METFASVENEKDTKKKKEFKTKQIVIPSLDFLDCIIADKDTVYPITVCVLSKGGGCSWTIESRDKLQDIYKCADVKKGNIVRASNARNETYVEISYNGRYTLQKEEFTKLEHMKPLTLNDVQDIYDSIYHSEDYKTRLSEEKAKQKELKESGLVD